MSEFVSLIWVMMYDSFLFIGLLRASLCDLENFAGCARGKEFFVHLV